MMRYVQVRKVVADSQIILGHTVAAARILLRAANSVRPIVVPHFHAVMLEPDVFGRHMRHKVVVIDQSPVIRKHKIRKVGKPVCR